MEYLQMIIDDFSNYIYIKHMPMVIITVMW